MAVYGSVYGPLYGGGTADVEVIFGTSNAVRLGAFDPIEVSATDSEVSGVEASTLMITAEFPTLGITELVYNGSEFGTWYQGTRNERTLYGLTGVTIDFLRDAGWPDTEVVVRVIAVDYAGTKSVATPTRFFLTPQIYREVL